MKRTLILSAALFALAGCAAVRDLRTTRANPYETDPFYVKYLDTGSALDARIREALEAVRRDPSAPPLHNDLGALLIEKGFPKDAEREFERAVAADRKYYQGWYNLGLVRAARGDEFGAWRALRRTVALKPGHSAALFQLGLLEEKRQHVDRAVALYAKAFRINPALLDVEVNPRILDSHLTHLALLKGYPADHNRRSMQLQDAPVVREILPVPETQPAVQSAPAPSPQPAPQQIIPPAAPATDPAMTPAFGAGTAPRATGSTRSRRPRRIEPQPAPEPVPATPVEIEEETPPFEPPPVDEMTEEEQQPETEEEAEEEEQSEEPPPPPPGR